MGTVTLAAAETVARFAFPGYADDSQYGERLFGRFMNSGVVVQNRAGDPRRFLAYTPNEVQTFVAPEYRYTMHTNSLGFRSKEIDSPKAGVFRVLLLGDSMFLGIGAEEGERIDVRLEEAGKQGAGGGIPSLSVLNFSVGGFNTAQELAVLRHFIGEARPDVVVLGFFVANDFLPNATVSVDEAGNYAVDPQRTQALKEQVGTDRPFLFFPSVVWRILALNLYVPRLRYTVAATAVVMDRSFDFLRRMQQECQEHGAKLLVVVIYPIDGVRGGWVEAWSGSRGVGRQVTEFCRQQGIEVLDLLSAMSGSADATRLFFRKDGHLNPEGNRVVADAVYRELLASHLRPAVQPERP
jgi:hypothetical protein